MSDEPVRRHGRAGAPALYLPTSHGDVGEFERYGLPAVLAPWIDSERLQVFAVDGGGPRSFWNDAIPPKSRVDAYTAFERHLVRERIPEIAELTGHDRVIAIGASYGALVAAELVLKHPRLVRVAGAFGGVFGLWHRLDGHHDDDVYFHTPLEFLPRLDDPAILGAIRETGGIDLYAAEDDPWLSHSLRLRDVLASKSLPHRLEVWPSPAAHHEAVWAEQIRAFAAARFGA